jgi:hypothetical protein
MPTAKEATTSAHTQTVDGEAFSPVTDKIHHHGRDPEAPSPETLEGFAEETHQLTGYLLEAAGILKKLADVYGSRASPMCRAVAGLSRRTSARLSELSDALSEGHTENVGHRMDDVRIMTLHAHGATKLAWETAEEEKSVEIYAGAFAVASNALDYCRHRLDHLLYEVDPLLD